jgi:hypothetical protein
MPSRHNIKRPFTLVCPARSGSSLVQNIFEHHPKCQVVGETGHILFYTWFGLTESEGIVVRGADQLTSEGYILRAGEAARELLLSFFPSDKPAWMQKPIGIPEVHWYFSARRKEASFADWYWSGFEALFPEARFFSILRDPRDVTVSAMAYFKVTERQAWEGIERVYDLLLHERSLVQHAILYQDLVERPEKVVRQLCEYSELEFDTACLKAFDYLYVQTPPEPGKPWSHRHRKPADYEKEQISFSRCNSWDTLEMGELGCTVMAKAAKLWKKFDYNFARSASRTEIFLPSLRS